MKTLIIAAALLLAGCGGAEPTPEPATKPAAKAKKATKAKKDTKAKGKKAKGKAGGKAGPADLANGAKVYTTYCQACHQVDGTGMNGMLAGNFVADKERLAKTDAELLTSIRDGKTGKIGAMPPWKGTLSEQDMVDVLAHIRKTYGE